MDFLFVGGAAWLDFVNTEKISHGARVDLLSTPEDLAEWAKAANLTSDRHVPLLHAKKFRAELRGLAEALSNGRNAPVASLQAINAELRKHSGYFEVVLSDGSYGKRFVESGNALLGQLAESAAQTLCEGNPSFVRRCDNPNCILYFYDTTKNHGRRFCSPAVCGNRMKVAAHYRRKREGS